MFSVEGSNLLFRHIKDSLTLVLTT